MYASDYLRVKFQSDRQLSIYAQNGFTNTLHAAKGVASDIYSGLERASWYSSCLVPKYNNVCQELKAEEVRSFFSIQSIFRYDDVIAHMLYLYFETVCDDIKEGSPTGSARDFVRQAAALASHIGVAGGTRYTICSGLSMALAHSELMAKVVVEKISGAVPFFVFVFQVYGMQQKSAMAARALKALNPKYYWILYQAKLEMLYYFIEPVLSEIIRKVKLGAYSDLDELTNDIKERVSV
jgi:hypothetical protein